jgi:anti-anti-sigma regulatory factor
LGTTDSQPAAPEAVNTLLLEGVVTVAAAVQLRDAAFHCANASQDVTVECAQLEHVDASVVQILISLKRELDALGYEFRMRSVPPSIVRLLAISGLSMLTQNEASEA